MTTGRVTIGPAAATTANHVLDKARENTTMAPFRVPGSPGEFEPGDSSTPGSAPGSHSTMDIFRDSIEESTLLPDGLSMDTAPGDRYGPGYEGEIL